MNHWLMKSEPEAYSIDALARDRRTSWEGVRNYQARNIMRTMKKGDLVIFYHSNASPSGAAGVARIARAAYPDSTAWDPLSPYHDPKSLPENPAWSCVDVSFVEKFSSFVPLPAIRSNQACDGMLLLARGSRLSVQPVTRPQFEAIRKMGLR